MSSHSSFTITGHVVHRSINHRSESFIIHKHSSLVHGSDNYRSETCIIHNGGHSSYVQQLQVNRHSSSQLQVSSSQVGQLQQHVRSQEDSLFTVTRGQFIGRTIAGRRNSSSVSSYGQTITGQSVHRSDNYTSQVRSQEQSSFILTCQQFIGSGNHRSEKFIITVTGQAVHRSDNCRSQVRSQEHSSFTITCQQFIGSGNHRSEL